MNDEAKSPLVIISGLSGSGKSVALNALEDLSYYCVDNLPGGLLSDLLDEIRSQPERYPKVAVGIDARTGPDGLERLVAMLDSLPRGKEARLLFMEASAAVLIRRFSETRRRHPLASRGSLETAVKSEHKLMQPIGERADWVIDTSETNIHQLRRQVWRKIAGVIGENVQSVVLESFAFKRGVPRDADLMFDARCLPNPHWEPALRARTGLDPEVAEYLEGSERVRAFRNELLDFAQRWLPAMMEDQRALVTLAIGCTGGQHRSVYLADYIGRALQESGWSVTITHRELDQ